MKTRQLSFVGTGAALALVAGLVGCGGSTAKPESAPVVTPLNAQLAASRHAVGDLLDACVHGDTRAVRRHTVAKLRGRQWGVVCHAIRDHHVKLVSAKVDLHGDSMTARVVLQAGGKDPRHFDEMWRFEYHPGDGWELAHVPASMLGGWDHDEHAWGTPTTSPAPGRPSTTGPHGSTTPTHDDQRHDDHQSSTSTTVHHDEPGHEGSTSTTVHHDEPGHEGSTSTTVHHDEPEHAATPHR